MQKYNKKTKMETSEPVAPQDVYKEFAENIAERYNISSFKSKVCMFVMMAFLILSLKTRFNHIFFLPSSLFRSYK